jgi:hypothetical protein
MKGIFIIWGTLIFFDNLRETLTQLIVVRYIDNKIVI